MPLSLTVQTQPFKLSAVLLGLGEVQTSGPKLHGLLWSNRSLWLFRQCQQSNSPSSCSALLQLSVYEQAQMQQVLEYRGAVNVGQLIQKFQGETFLELGHQSSLIPLDVLADHLEVIM